MKMIFYKNLWLRSLYASLISVALCWLFYIILDFNVLDYLSKQDGESDVISYFYRIENHKSSEPEKYHSAFHDDNIVIYDLAGTSSRLQIARALDSIISAQPKAVVLDVIFPQVTATDSFADSLLTSVLSRANNIYTATRLTDTGIEKSFYAGTNSVHSGLANMNNYYQPYETVGGDTLYYLPYLVLGETGKPNRSKQINYKDKHYFSMTINEPLDPSLVRDKIVLVGDLSDLRDYHDMNFPVYGSRRVPGVILMAYCMTTITRGDWITITSKWWGIVLAFVLSLLLVRLNYYLFDEKRRRDKATGELTPHVPSIWKNFTETGIRLVMVFVLLWAGYALFSAFDVVVNLVYAMAATALSGFATDIVELVWEKCERCKVRKNRLKTANKQ
jgi:hypothetical protein